MGHATSSGLPAPPVTPRPRAARTSDSAGAVSPRAAGSHCSSCWWRVHRRGHVRMGMRHHPGTHQPRLAQDQQARLLERRRRCACWNRTSCSWRRVRCVRRSVTSPRSRTAGRGSRHAAIVALTRVLGEPGGLRARGCSGWRTSWRTGPAARVLERTRSTLASTTTKRDLMTHSAVTFVISTRPQCRAVATGYGHYPAQEWTLRQRPLAVEITLDTEAWARSCGSSRSPYEGRIAACRRQRRGMRRAASAHCDAGGDPAGRARTVIAAAVAYETRRPCGAAPQVRVRSGMAHRRGSGGSRRLRTAPDTQNDQSHTTYPARWGKPSCSRWFRVMLEARLRTCRGASTSTTW